MSPEAAARETIDAHLVAAGWAVQDYNAFNPAAVCGIALREVPLASGRCDYLLLVDCIPVVKHTTECATSNRIPFRNRPSPNKRESWQKWSGA